MDTNTINLDSPVGNRLEKFPKQEIIELSYQGKSFPIASEIRIGRDKINHISIDDKLVSRNHAVIQKIKDAYFIKDFNSTNGTFVNNEKVQPGKYVKLHKNDILKIGRTEIRIV